MKTFLAVIAIALTVLISGCITEPVCGDGKCESGESFESCPSDCESPYTYTYGAKFEPPEGKIIHAMGNWEEGNNDYLGLLDNSLYPASTLSYWGSFIDCGDECVRPWSFYEQSIKKALATESAAGRIPHLNFGFGGDKEDIETDPYFALDEEIANTNKHDQLIKKYAKIVADYKKPVFVRIGFEFEGFWNGYQPYEYPKAFRKAVNIFREEGADNAAFVWCFTGATNDFDEKNAQGEWKWFPGDDVIDWYSIDIFRSDDFTGPLTKDGESTTYGNLDRFLKMAASHGKPVILAETSAINVDITSSQQDGEKDWNTWFVPYFGLMEKYPQIKAFHYINVDWTDTPWDEQGWQQANIKVNPYISQKFVEEISEEKYLHVDEVGKLKDHWKYK